MFLRNFGKLYQITWRHNLEDSTLHSHRRKVFKFNAVVIKVAFLKQFKVLEKENSAERIKKPNINYSGNKMFVL
jgi:hypothetical protein